MPRKPTQQHRALAAILQGRIVRVKVDARKKPSWQWWTGERWRPVTGAEHNALNTMLTAPRPMIEIYDVAPDGHWENIRATDYGEITAQLWEKELGPAPQ